MAIQKTVRRAGATSAHDGASSSAASMYKDRATEVTKLISDIHAKLRAHAKRQKARETDYGYAGDLAHVAEQLRHIKRFLG